MLEFSEYEENMISFLMGHGLSQQDARQEVIEWRIDTFGDGSHVATKEDVDLCGRKLKTVLPIRPKLNPYDKVDAFRFSIGEEAWANLGAETVKRELLVRAINFNHDAWVSDYEKRHKDDDLRREGLSDAEIYLVGYYMSWYEMSREEAKEYVLNQRHSRQNEP